jgi:hypothetical protein
MKKNKREKKRETLLYSFVIVVGFSFFLPIKKNKKIPTNN